MEVFKLKGIAMMAVMVGLTTKLSKTIFNPAFARKIVSTEF